MAPSSLPGERVQQRQSPTGSVLPGGNRLLEPVEKAANIVGSFYGAGGVGTAAKGALSGVTGGAVGGYAPAESGPDAMPWLNPAAQAGGGSTWQSAVKRFLPF